MCAWQIKTGSAGYYDILLRTHKNCAKDYGTTLQDPQQNPIPAHALHMNDGQHLIIVYDPNTSLPWIPGSLCLCVGVWIAPPVRLFVCVLRLTCP